MNTLSEFHYMYHIPETHDTNPRVSCVLFFVIKTLLDMHIDYIYREGGRREGVQALSVKEQLINFWISYQSMNFPNFLKDMIDLIEVVRVPGGNGGCKDLKELCLKYVRDLPLAKYGDLIDSLFK
jgi:hypothetical protein